jgi:hypothetical protein
MQPRDFEPTEEVVQPAEGDLRDDDVADSENDLYEPSQVDEDVEERTGSEEEGISKEKKKRRVDKMEVHNAVKALRDGAASSTEGESAVEGKT